MGSIIPRIELERKLEGLKPHPSPRVELEQYTIPAKVAAEMLFTAAYIYNDLADKLVADLGCGTGRLGIGALILGAASVVGIDLDPAAVAVAVENAEASHVLDRSHWIIGDPASIRGVLDTVIMNPPFGTRRRHLDVVFLSEAMRLAPAIYSLHKSSTRRFVTGFIRRRGYMVSTTLRISLEIPWMFTFHRRERRPVSVDLYRIVRPTG